MSNPPAIHRTITQQILNRGIENADFICRKVQDLLLLRSYWIKSIQNCHARDYESIQKYLEDWERCYDQMAKIYEDILPYENLAKEIYPDFWKSPMLLALREHYLAMKERK